MTLFKEQTHVERNLKNQSINSFNEMHLLDLKEDYIRSNNVTIQDTFEHLYENYGKIIDNDLLEKRSYD